MEVIGCHCIKRKKTSPAKSRKILKSVSEGMIMQIFHDNVDFSDVPRLLRGGSPTCIVSKNPEVSVGGNDPRLKHLLPDHLSLLMNSTPSSPLLLRINHHYNAKANHRSKGEWGGVTVSRQELITQGLEEKLPDHCGGGEDYNHGER